jgi:hypothetical protein
MAKLLKPSEELTVSAISATLVYAIFSLNAPNLADVRADQPNNMNTYKSVNTATWTSAAVVSGVALLSKSPTVFVVGGIMTLIEAWKHHFANFGTNGTQENQNYWTQTKS